METPNFGPNWFWNLVLIMAIVGFLSGLVIIALGIIWSINHIQITL